MGTASSNIWKTVYDFVLICGRIHEPYEFGIGVVQQLRTLVPFDQALVFYLDDNRQIVSDYLLDVDKKWSKLFYRYYSKSLRGKYSLFRDVKDDDATPFMEDILWEEEPLNDFVVDYVRMRELRESLNFNLFDLNGSPKIVFVFDRIGTSPCFSPKERNLVKAIVPQLNNLHKNFYSQAAQTRKSLYSPPDLDVLTKRESEILERLCNGLTPELIGKELHISIATAYKHIAHIYKKLNVSNKQELLVKMLRNRD